MRKIKKGVLFTLGCLVIFIFSFNLALDIVSAISLNSADCDTIKTSGFYDIAGTSLNCDSNTPALDGITFNANHTVIDCGSDLLTSTAGDAGFGFSLYRVNQNMTVRNCRITNYATSGILFTDSNNTFIRDTTISTGTMTHIRLNGVSHNNTLLNVTFTTEAVAANSNFTRAWYLNVTVTNGTSGAFVQEATVTAYNGTNAVFTGTTAADGTIIFWATDYINHAGSRINLSSYTINATKTAYNVSTTTTVLTTSRDISLSLGPAPTPADTTPPNFTSIQTNQSSAAVGQFINFSAIVQDDTTVDKAWLSHNFDLKDNQSIVQTAGTTGIGFGNTTWLAQTFSFTTGSYYLRSVCFKVFNNTGVAGPSSDIYVEVRSTAAAIPTGSNLTTKAVINKSGITGTGQASANILCANFTKPVQLTRSVLYSIVISSPLSRATNKYSIVAGGTYTGGTRRVSSNSGSTWGAAQSDMYFNFTGSYFIAKNETPIDISASIEPISQIKQLLWAQPANFFTYRWCANDTTGNQNCSSPQTYTVLENYEVAPETNQPTVSLISPPNNTKVNGNVTLFATATDDTGVAYVSFLYRNSTVSFTNLTGCNSVTTGSPYSCIWDTKLYGNATEGYDIKVVACDIFGNCANATTVQTPYTSTILMEENTNYANGFVQKDLVVDTTSLALHIGDESLDGDSRAFLDFNTSALPNNAIITNVTLQLNKIGSNTPAVGYANLTIYSLNQTVAQILGNGALIRDKCYGGSGSNMTSMNNSAFSLTLGQANTVRNISFNSNATADLQARLSQDFFTLCLISDDEVQFREMYMSSNRSATPEYRPRLFVEYTLSGQGAGSSPDVKHYVIDRQIPIDSQQVVYPAGQMSIRNTQQLIFRLNVTDGSGAGINLTRVDLTQINTTGNSTMVLQSGSPSTGQWSYWNISSILSGSTTGLKQIPFYALDNATPTNNILFNTFSLQIDNAAPNFTNLGIDTNPVYNNTNVTFQLDASDNLNLSYYIFSNNFSGTFVNITKNFTVGGLSDSASNVSTLYTGTYQWWFLIYDNAGNLNETPRQTLTVLAPEAPVSLNVNLISPVDYYNSSTTSVTFQYNYTGPTASACMLMVDNIEVNKSIGPTNATTLSFINVLTQEQHEWYAQCNNTDGTFYQSAEVRTVTVDATAPAATQTTPLNNSFTNNQNVNFTFNVSDNIELANASLNIYNSTNDLVNKTSTTLFGRTQQVISIVVNLADGFFKWFVDVFDIGGNKASTGNFTFTLDSAVPIFTNMNETPSDPTIYISGTRYEFNVTITNNIDAVKIEFNGVNYTSRNLTANLYNFTTTNLKAGTYNYYWWANDTAGNINQTAIQTYTISQAQSAVFTYLNNSRSNITILNNTSIFLNTSLINGTFGTLRLINNGTTINVGSSNLSNLTLFSKLGFYNITGFYDGNENYSSSYETWYANVTLPDTTKPLIQFVDPTYSNGANLSRTFILSNVTATDDVLLSNITIFLYNTTSLVNSSIKTSSPYFLNFTSLIDGIYYINATAADSNSNSNSTETRTITLDVTSPRTSQIIPINGTFFTSTSVNFTYNASDNLNLANITLYVFNSTNNIINQTTTQLVSQTSKTISTIINLGDGRYKWYTKVYDGIGNSAETNNITIYIDAVTPTIVTTSPSSGSSSNGGGSGGINFTANVTDAINGTGISNVTIKIYNNATGILINQTTTTIPNQGVFSRFFSFFVSLGDGVYKWFVDVFDFAGNNVASSNSTIIFDATNSQIVFVSPTPNNNTIQNSASFVVNVSGNETNRVNVWITLNSTNFTTTCQVITSELYSCNKSFSLPDGIWNYTAYINDTSGNQNQTEMRFITIDTVTPSVSISAPTANQNFTTTSIGVTFSATDTNRDACWSTKDDGTTNTSRVCATGSFTDTYSQGSNTVTVYSNDTAGNIGSANVTFIVDSINPSISYGALTESDGSTLTTRNNTVINITVSDTNYANMTIRLFNSTAQIRTNTSTSTSFLVNYTNLPDGTYYFNATAYDTFGNSASTTTRTVTISVTGGIECGTIPTNGCLVSSTTTFNTNTYQFNGTSTGAIIANANNIVINGNSSTLTGNGTRYGIYISGKNNVTITSITVSNYLNNIFFNNSVVTIISNILQSKNITNFGGTSNIYISPVSNPTIYNSTLTSGTQITNSVINASLRDSNALFYS